MAVRISSPHPIKQQLVDHKVPFAAALPCSLQQDPEWCWAACIQWVVQLLEGTCVKQCAIVNAALGLPNDCCAEPKPLGCRTTANEQRLESAYDQQHISLQRWTGTCGTVPSALQQGQVLHVRMNFPREGYDHDIIVHEADTGGNVCCYDPRRDCSVPDFCAFDHGVDEGGGVWVKAWIPRKM